MGTEVRGGMWVGRWAPKDFIKEEMGMKMDA